MRCAVATLREITSIRSPLAFTPAGRRIAVAETAGAVGPVGWDGNFRRLGVHRHVKAKRSGPQCCPPRHAAFSWRACSLYDAMNRKILAAFLSVTDRPASRFEIKLPSPSASRPNVVGFRERVLQNPRICCRSSASLMIVRLISDNLVGSFR